MKLRIMLVLHKVNNWFIFEINAIYSVQNLGAHYSAHDQSLDIEWTMNTYLITKSAKKEMLCNPRNITEHYSFTPLHYTRTQFVLVYDANLHTFTSNTVTVCSIASKKIEKVFLLTMRMYAAAISTALILTKNTHVHKVNLANEPLVLWYYLNGVAILFVWL